MASPDILATDRLAKAFSPTHPIQLPTLLAGRLDLLYRLQDDILNHYRALGLDLSIPYMLR